MVGLPVTGSCRGEVNVIEVAGFVVASESARLLAGKSNARTIAPIVVAAAMAWRTKSKVGRIERKLDPMRRMNGFEQVVALATIGLHDELGSDRPCRACYGCQKCGRVAQHPGRR